MFDRYLYLGGGIHAWLSDINPYEEYIGYIDLNGVKHLY